jgi:Lysylphosphatidylglycerol synthase TM region
MVFFLALSSFRVWARVQFLQETVILLLFAVGGGLLIFWAAVFMRQRFVLQFKNVMHWLGLDRLGIVQRLLDMLEALVAQEQNTIVSALLRGTVLSLLYMTLTMAYSYARFQIFHVPADFWVIIFITSIMQFISIIPIQIFGGLGVSELTLVYLFSLFGVTQVDIAAIVVALRVLFYLFNLAVMVYLPVDALLNKLKYLESKSLS